ncbi:MAG: hypothetical protein RIQ89_2171 [Bacteroidota bacterium]
MPSALNLLPYDGQVTYHPNFVTDAALFEHLSSLASWQHDHHIIFGKKIITQRKYIWMASHHLSYAYSGHLHHPTPWTPPILALKDYIHHQLGLTFNSCLLNYYANGHQYMGYHSDAESSLGHQPTIASISLGAERDFCFKHQVTKQVVKLTLAHGSLLCMQGPTQHCWKHALPKRMHVHTPRINLTFRKIVNQ